MLCSTFHDDSFFESSLDRVSDGASLLGSLLVQLGPTSHHLEGAINSVIL